VCLFVFSMNCPLCSSTRLAPVALPERRDGQRCADCDLVSLAAAHWLTPELEHERYLMHRNSRDDQDYVTFLERLTTPLESHLAPPAKILDFGSGPTPVLAELLHERGYEVTMYDTFFANDKFALQAQYDAVVCCETAEHFRDPAIEWGRMMNCLRSGGLLAVMTLLHDDMDLKNWWYARDPTHVCFYSSRTMTWLAPRFACDIVQQDRRVTLLRKK